MIAGAVGAEDAKLSDFLLKFDADPAPAPKRVKMTPDMLKLMFTMGGETVIDKRASHDGSR